MTTSIMIVGVGGQGTLLASKLLGNVLIARGYDVKLSEVHGMSQRGGSVVTYVKYGDKVYSPVVDQGEADYILSFEILESARWISYLKEGGVLLTNTQKTWPMPVITGAMEYPEGIVEKLSAMADVQAVDALKLAEQAGSPKAVNVVLIGVLSRRMDIPEEAWIKAIEETVPQGLPAGKGSVGGRCSLTESPHAISGWTLQGSSRLFRCPVCTFSRIRSSIPRRCWACACTSCASCARCSWSACRSSYCSAGT